MASTLTAHAPQTDSNYSLSLAIAAARAAADNRGQDVLVLDMREQTAIFDYFVVATGSSQRQLRAMGDAIDDVLQKELDHHRLGTEGYKVSRWLLLDYGSVVVHLFDGPMREYYRIEELWDAAQKVDWKLAQD